ncbi:MAG: hypothetical protein A2W05_06520 [Candidatus Schekmanbacteria bacterium RBG_16_38_10]|uniref:Uncharacterized protein n=1 Tax=Candidatus Schekmanbacteria bacterium RBG_16_38_10 TaxID=1817879 RepID=A0A1F7RTY7_9BACT|nr:MAG: hypothetical protein A2W05_06520 [Candidatus Schekmanbacteria bacterium RBG_16_38_10]
MGITFRFCEENDIERLVLFHREACGADSLPEFWRWKYFENTAGPSCIALALDGERIVGRIGFIPVRFRLDSNVVTAAQQVDSDILQEYRKGGTYFSLSRMVRTEGEKRKLSFGYGFAIESTKEISVKYLGYRVVSPVRRVMKILDPTQYIERTVKIPGTRLLGKSIGRLIKLKEEIFAGDDSDIFEVHNFDSRFDDLWKRARLGRIMAIKDSEYLNWRYLKCPTVKYVVFAKDERIPQGFIVLHTALENNIKYGIIDDLIWNPDIPDIIKCLISRATKYFIEEGVENIISWAPQNDFFKLLLRKKGFVDRPMPHYLIAISRKDDGRLEGFIEDEKNWYYMLGDSDYRLIPRTTETVNHPSEAGVTQYKS